MLHLPFQAASFLPLGPRFSKYLQGNQFLVAIRYEEVYSPYQKAEGDIPAGILEYAGREYGKADIAVIDNDGDELLDPHEMDFHKKAEAEETHGKNIRLLCRNLKMTQPELAEKLGTAKQAISNMENGIRPISKKTAKEISGIFKVSVSNFI